MEGTATWVDLSFNTAILSRSCIGNLTFDVTDLPVLWFNVGMWVATVAPPGYDLQYNGGDRGRCAFRIPAGGWP